MSAFKLTLDKSYTLGYEHQKDVAQIAASPCGSFLVSVDVDGRMIMVHLERDCVVARMGFNEQVGFIEFSPDGKYMILTFWLFKGCLLLGWVG